MSGRNTGRLGKNDGFTLVELIMVLVIIGILAAFALPRMFDRRTYDALEFADQARSMMQYAQKIAVAQNRPVFVRLLANSVALCFDAACLNPVAPAAGTNSGSDATDAACGNSTWACEAPPTGITYTALNAAAVNYVTPANPSFFFNALGQPYNTGDLPPNSTFTQLLTFTVNDGGPAHTFFVERDTGYVHE